MRWTTTRSSLHDDGTHRGDARAAGRGDSGHFGLQPGREPSAHGAAARMLRGGLERGASQEVSGPMQPAGPRETCTRKSSRSWQRSWAGLWQGWRTPTSRSRRDGGWSRWGFVESPMLKNTETVAHGYARKPWHQKKDAAGILDHSTEWDEQPARELSKVSTTPWPGSGRGSEAVRRSGR